MSKSNARDQLRQYLARDVDQATQRVAKFAAELAATLDMSASIFKWADDVVADGCRMPVFKAAIKQIDDGVSLADLETGLTALLLQHARSPSHRSTSPMNNLVQSLTTVAYAQAIEAVRNFSAVEEG